MLYLFSFKKLEQPIILSEKRNISLTNIATEYEKKFFTNQFFKYQLNSSLGIIPRYFTNNNGLEKIIKIDFGINFENYSKCRFSMNPDERKLAGIDTSKIEENHNILNVFLFALSLIQENNDLSENNLYLENLDSNKYQKIESKVMMKEFTKIKFAEYLDFSVIEKDLVELFWFFDFQYEKINIENFIYVGEMIELYHSTKSDYFRFSQLVSIIEFLLTKGKKDLTQQFIFKGGIIMERILLRNSILDKKNFSVFGFNQNESSKELDGIYDIRSLIVHGSLKEISEKYPRIEGEFNDFESLFWRLKLLTAGLLYTYIQEPEYINFLKSN